MCNVEFDKQSKNRLARAGWTALGDHAYGIALGGGGLRVTTKASENITLSGEQFAELVSAFQVQKVTHYKVTRR